MIAALMSTCRSASAAQVEGPGKRWGGRSPGGWSKPDQIFAPRGSDSSCLQGTETFICQKELLSFEVCYTTDDEIWDNGERLHQMIWNMAFSPVMLIHLIANEVLPKGRGNHLPSLGPLPRASWAQCTVGASWANLPPWDQQPRMRP